MGYSEDLVNAVRRSFLPQLHYLFRGTFDGYAVSHTTAEEYVMTAHCSEDVIEDVLERLGFSRNPIAALKVRMDGNTAEGSWVWRASPLASHQLHVVLHTLEDREHCVDVYAHWECSWIRHPFKHYAARGYDAEKGVELTRELLERHGDDLFDGEFEYEVDTSLERRLSEYFSLSYYQVKEWTMAVRSRLPLADGDDGSLVQSRDGERDEISPRITDQF